MALAWVLLIILVAYHKVKDPRIILLPKDIYTLSSRPRVAIITLTQIIIETLAHIIPPRKHNHTHPLGSCLTAPNSRTPKFWTKYRYGVDSRTLRPERLGKGYDIRSRLLCPNRGSPLRNPYYYNLNPNIKAGIVGIHGQPLYMSYGQNLY